MRRLVRLINKKAKPKPASKPVAKQQVVRMRGCCGGKKK